MKRTVCFDGRVIRSWDSGVGRITVSLLRELSIVGSDFELLLLLHERADAITPPLPAAVQISVLPMDCPSLRQHLQLGRWLERQGVDVVFYLHPYSVSVSCRIPQIVSILDLYQVLQPEHFPVGTALYYRVVIGPLARRAAGVVTISEVSKSDIVRLLRVPPERITVLCLAPGEVFRPIPFAPERDAVLRRLGVCVPFVLYHGNQRPHKNLIRLVQAFALARRRFGLSHGLVITGRDEPGSRERDFSLVRSEIRVQGVESIVDFPGYVTDEELAVLYSTAGALFLPSLMEGFGLPVVEAFACGTPVVCARRGALVEVAGDAAALVDPLDVDGMAEVLGEVLTNPKMAADLSSRGVARAAGFSWHRAARELTALLTKVTEQA